MAQSLLPFLTSFCSLTYQQALALTLSDVTGKFVLSQALCLGFFLCGMGLGAWRCERASYEPRSRLVKVEGRLTLLGLFSVPFIQMIDVLVKGSVVWCLTLPYVGLIGFLAGQEIPLLLAFNTNSSSAKILGWNYFGALVATAVIPTIFIPIVDVDGVVIIASLVNYVLMAGLYLRIASPLRLSIASTITLIAVVGWTLIYSQWKDFYLKSIYFHPNIARVGEIKNVLQVMKHVEAPTRLRSSYQWIDILRPTFTQELQGEQEYSLFLDRKLQFSSGFYHRYHQSMVHGAVNLLKREPAKILIIGGGDGLLLPEILKYTSVKNVDLVELDPEMIRLARHEPTLKRMNHGLLDDARVKVFIEDGFQFIRRTKDHYDVIFADLPYPNNYDLSLLYSKEFYILVKRRLTNDGIFILDFPPSGIRLEGFSDLLATLQAAGFAKPFVFGSEDMFVTSAAQPLTGFNFSTLAAHADNSTLMNLVSRAGRRDEAMAHGGRVNSIFFPILFSDSDWTKQDDEVERDIPYAENPGLLPLFLNRFRAFHDRQFKTNWKNWPQNLLSYWSETFNEPRAFTEILSTDFRWPRFQWVHVLTGNDHDPNWIQWFDFNSSEKLRLEWKKAFGFAGDSAWVGVTWGIIADQMEFHTPIYTNGNVTGFNTRIFHQRKFLREETSTLDEWKKSLLLRDNATGGLPLSLPIQRLIGREFLITPRFQRLAKDRANERLYFP